MDGKISIYNLAEMLSEKTGGNVADNEKFIRELVAVVNEGIFRDQTVAVKGVGTFKVVQVKERESIHVNTGERFVIPSHHKLSFIPEKELKDLINKPFAAFEAIEALEDSSGIMNLTIAEKESVEKVEDVNEVEETPLPVKEEQLPVISNEEVKKQEIIEEKNEVFTETVLLQEPPIPLSDKEIIDQIREEKAAQAPPPLPSPPPLPPPPSSPPSPPSPPQPDKTEKKRKRRSRSRSRSRKSTTKLLLAVLFFLLFILIAGGAWYFFFYNKSLDELFVVQRPISQIAGERTLTVPVDSMAPEKLVEESNTTLDSIANVQPEVNEMDTTKTVVSEPVTAPVSEPVVTATTPETVTPSTTSRPASTTRTQPNTTSRPANTTPSQTNTTSSSNTVLARITMQPGQRLTLLAEEYYGHKVFWVYIYEHNKAKIGSNPDIIPVGMEIIVPAKSVYDIDANSAASIERATALQRRIMSSY